MTSVHTKVISKGRPDKINDGPINTPVSLNSSYHAGGDVGYGRYGNDTCSSLEEVIASLEKGRTLAFSSGMSATQSILNLAPIGAKIIASNQGYAGVNATLKKLNDANKIKSVLVDITNTGEVIGHLEDAWLLWIESPTNPMLQVADIERLIKSAKRNNVIIVVDNTFATPINQVPLDMGADISINSVSKYFAGHTDVLGGSISTNNEDLYNLIEFERKISGTIIQPFEAFLALRGIRTFPMRFERAEKTAKYLIDKLSSHNAIKSVNYPGFGAMISFEINGTPEDAEKVCSSSRLIANATSLGGVESLWERRRRWELESKIVPETLIRLSVGCEDEEDLWNDIKYCLDGVL
jgi:cystathionine gamma-synthase